MQLQPAQAPIGGRYDTPRLAVVVHLTTVLPALLLGAFVLANRKGDRLHRSLGRLWLALMLITAIASFWIRGPHGGFSGIHLFSLGTAVAVPAAIASIHGGNVKAHRQILTSLYVGLIVAGAFALDSGRLAGIFLLGLFR
ncbi:DUF2306 domain-containing protein [Devosia sp. CAU 1758]